MTIYALICQRCGAPLNVVNENDIIKCAYCGTEFLIQGGRLQEKFDEPVIANQTTADAVNTGIMLIILIIMLVIGAYFTALLLPGAVAELARKSFTAVSPAVALLFQTVVSLSVVGTIIALFVGLIWHTWKNVYR